MPPVTLKAQAGNTAVTHAPCQEQSHRGGNATCDPHREGMAPLQSERRGVGETTTTLSSETGPRFFNLVQPHVAESAWYAWATTIIPLQSVKRQSYGMDQQTHPKRASRECWSQQMASRSASTGRSPGAAVRSVTRINTDAQGAGNLTTGLKDALEHRGCNPLTPTTGGRGQSSWLGWDWKENIPTLFRGSQRVSMWEYHRFRGHMPP